MNKNKKLLLFAGIIIIVFCLGIFTEASFNIFEYKTHEMKIDKDTVIEFTEDIGVILELQREGLLDSIGYLKFNSIEMEDGRYFLKVKKVEH